MLHCTAGKQVGSGSCAVCIELGQGAHPTYILQQARQQCQPKRLAACSANSLLALDDANDGCFVQLVDEFARKLEASRCLWCRSRSRRVLL